MFPSAKPVVAVVHAGALPGTPAGGAALCELERVVRAECAIYRDAAVHGIILENMHDVPYLRGAVGPEITAAMAVLARAVKDESRLPLYLGSGITAENLPRYVPLADGFVVGSDFKCDGRWNQTVDRQRVDRFMAAHARCT